MLEPRILPADEIVASAILDHVRLPAFLVERTAEIRYSNAAGMATLKDANCVIEVGNLLCAAHPTDDGRLKAAIANACATGERQTIMITNTRTPRPQIVRVVPFHDDNAPAENGALVFVRKCEASDEVFAGSLRQLFRLSAAETSIASALVYGADLEQIAEMRHAKITTVRTQISAMMLKTRTRRQGELVALFSRIGTLP